MHLNRILLSTPLLVVALIVQVSILARLQLPGAVPDLMLLVVLALALVYGHTGGCLVGFAAGLLADLAPPADHAVGRYALVLAVIGYLAGLARPERGGVRSATGPLLVVVAGAISTTLLYASVGALVGDNVAKQVGVGSLILTAALYDLILAPFVVPGVMWLARRVENDPMSENAGPGAGVDNALRGFTATSSLLNTRAGRKIGRLSGQRGSMGGLGGGMGGGRVGFGSGLLRSARSRSGRMKAGRIKGVKRL
ncbi:rod shape-determining protein MreD [Streptomyces pathocidini]|uniref:Rod shape-determining protein MreD n=1 Tax=Streptomyces pathocidini TaxID=1650571 RepID=A0ABW7UR51_9ACTN